MKLVVWKFKFFHYHKKILKFQKKKKPKNSKIFSRHFEIISNVEKVKRLNKDLSMKNPQKKLKNYQQKKKFKNTKNFLFIKKKFFFSISLIKLFIPNE